MLSLTMLSRIWGVVPGAASISSAAVIGSAASFQASRWFVLRDSRDRMPVSRIAAAHH
jgi:uncharacterized membrane protein YdjX (TVP38/TMEM64 family)